MTVAHDFFSLTETTLADANRAMGTNETVESFSNKLYKGALNSTGFPGLSVFYSVLALRRRKVTLPTFHQSAILDIKGGWISKKVENDSPLSHLELKRFHIPSKKIITEMREAYDRRGYAKASTHHITAMVCERYLHWMLYFFFHRAVILNNAEAVVKTIKSAATIPEFTPRKCGYLSAFYDLGIPLALYSPYSISTNATMQSLKLFDRIIVGSGQDADAVARRTDTPVFVQRNERNPIHITSKKNYRIAMFLSSFYNMHDKDLAEFARTKIIPVAQGMEKQWAPSEIVAYSHPSDPRTAPLLEKGGVRVGQPSTSADRLKGFDVVVCGNTSVLGEAVDGGIPTIYSSLLDNYQHDLYGYVAKGLTFDGTDAIPDKHKLDTFYRQGKTRDIFERYRTGNGSHICGNLPDILIDMNTKAQTE